MDPTKRQELINSLPNEARALLQTVNAAICRMEEMEDTGQLTCEQRRAFFELIVNAIPYARIVRPPE